MTRHLEQATKDIEDNSVIIETLRQQQENEAATAAGGLQRKPARWMDLQQKLREKSLLLKSAQEMLSKVEEEAREKDKELADAAIVMRKYELVGCFSFILL